MHNNGCPHSLDSRQWQQLESCVERFEQQCRDGALPDLAAFLPASDADLRPIVLVELIKRELEIRWHKAQPVCLESYLSRFPDLVRDPGLFVHLLYEEYRVRQMYGDRPALVTYQDRFPDCFHELQQLVASRPIKAMVGVKYLPFGGGYKLLRRIGSGGFGEVWLAEAPGGIKAAVKVLFRPVDHEEAQREVQALELIKELRHPFLLQTQAYWTSEDRIYIVMELADGSLRDRLKECRQAGLTGIPQSELLPYFREAAEALDYLQKNHVRHADIKPENILVLQRHVKVADFGLARAQDSRRLVTASGSGTPFYLAPEVWRGKSSTHSDQYALAVSYTELCLDRRIFSSCELVQLMYDHLEQVPDLAPLPEAEQEVLRKALAKEPEQRYPTCSAFVEALERAVVHKVAAVGSAGRTKLQSSQGVALQGESETADSTSTVPCGRWFTWPPQYILGAAYPP